jgi:hypothetical protein
MALDMDYYFLIYYYMTNQILNLKKYDLLLLTNNEKSITNGGYWWVGVAWAVGEYVYEWTHDNSIKAGYDESINLFLNAEQRKRIK